MLHPSPEEERGDLDEMIDDAEKEELEHDDGEILEDNLAKAAFEEDMEFIMIELEHL